MDLKQVSADAKWAAHLDVDALMASKSMQKVREQIVKEHPDAESALAMIRTVWRFDPTTDLHGITIYGTQLKKDTGVAIIRAKVDQKFLLDLVKLTPGLQDRASTASTNCTAWVKDGKKHNAAFFQPDVIVFGTSVDELKAALDVLDGTKPNFAAKTPGSRRRFRRARFWSPGARTWRGQSALPSRRCRNRSTWLGSSSAKIKAKCSFAAR